MKLISVTEIHWHILLFIVSKMLLTRPWVLSTKLLLQFLHTKIRHNKQTHTHTPPLCDLPSGPHRQHRIMEEHLHPHPFFAPFFAPFNNIYDLQYALLIIPQSLTHRGSHYLKTILHLKQSVHYMKSCCWGWRCSKPPSTHRDQRAVICKGQQL